MTNYDCCGNARCGGSCVIIAGRHGPYSEICKCGNVTCSMCYKPTNPGAPSFEEAWAEKEKAGYKYGPDALEQVKFGWEIRDSWRNPKPEPIVTPPTRASWPETWMAVAQAISMKSYDPRLKVGAIIVSEDNTQMLSVGYNGNYKGGPHQHESAVPGQSGFIHAEVNALVKCDYNFGKRKHMYITHMPCRDCSKLIVNAEIATVVYGLPYRITTGVELLRSVGIEVLSIEEAILKAKA